MFRMRIQETKIMRIHADADPQHWWQPIRQNPEFRQQPLGGFCGVGQRWIRKKTYFLSGYVYVSTATAGALVPAAIFTLMLRSPPIGFCFSFRSQPPTAMGPQKIIHDWPPYPVLYFFSRNFSCVPCVVWSESNTQGEIILIRTVSF